jgi:hypothetical protein
LTDKLDSATAWVSEQLGRSLDGGTQTFTVHSRDGVLLLPTMQATAVTGVVGPDGYAATVDTRYTNLGSGVVVVTTRQHGPYTVTVTLPAVLPAPLYEAVLLIAAHLWDTQRGTSPTALQQIEAPVPGAAYAIPNRARDLLAPYLPPAVA